MEYYLTEHARDALAKRRITVEWMEQVLVAPDWTERDSVDPDLEHRLGRIEAFGGRVLRVIVNANARPPRIVTTYFDRRRKAR
jgi:hypothetical protein